MIRSLKLVGLGLIALLAMSALASVASAQFESEAESTTLSVSSNAMQKFAPSAGSTAIECTTISLTNSTQSGKATETVTVHPNYSNCETFLGAATSVNTTGCNFVFHLPKAKTSGTVDVECESGSAIVITVGSICRYHIATQTTLNSVSFSNSGSGSTRVITLQPSVTNITSVRTTNDLFCPAAGSTGTYSGSVTIAGFSSVQVGISVD